MSIQKTEYAPVSVSASSTMPDAETDLATDSTSTPAEQPPNQTLLRRLLDWLVRSIPTAIVLAVLAGLGWWGHRTSWAFPKFSQVTGDAAAQPDDWCDEHGVPESVCVECKPDEFPKRELHGWCKVHGIHECPLHHPDVAQLKSLPVIESRDVERADRALKLRPRAENNFACQNPGRRIQFASRDSATKAGVDVEPVLRAPIVKSIQATGEIRYDETRLARLASKAAGNVWRVEKQVGDQVQRGDLLALIDSTVVGQAKAELQQALAEWQFNSATHQRLLPLVESGSVSKSKILETEAAVRTSWIRVRGAHQSLINLGLPLPLDEIGRLTETELAARLHFAGLTAEAASQLDPSTTTSNLLPVTASLSGVVVARSVVRGEVVDNTKLLFTIADTSQMWLVLNTPLEEARYVTTGQSVRFVPDGEVDPVVGSIDWKSTSADQKTRTVSVRVTLPNSDGRLLNETFGVGHIELRRDLDAIVIPNAALQWDGSCHVVFVRDVAWFDDTSPRIFHTRSVRPGAKSGDFTEVIAGVLPGEVVATLGSDVLRAQLLKNNLGAG